jgi:hypothetical protein
MQSLTFALRLGRVGVVGRAVVAALPCFAPACESSRPPKTPADQATFVERTRCLPEDDDKQLTPILSCEALQGVRPLYNTIEGTKSGVQSELRGAVLAVSALPGVTAEWLDRALECHGARALLGHLSPAANDPFFVPGTFVDVDVLPAKDGFDIEVVAYSSEDARAVLDRATAFAKAGGKLAPPK